MSPSPSRVPLKPPERARVGALVLRSAISITMTANLTIDSRPGSLSVPPESDGLDPRGLSKIGNASFRRCIREYRER